MENEKEKKEKDEKEEKKGTGIFENFMCKKYWRWQLFILFVFMIGFGVIAYFLLSSQAYNLVRVSGYKEFSSNYPGSGKKNIAQKLFSFFSLDENFELEKRAKTGFNFDNSNITVANYQEKSSVSNEEKDYSSSEPLPYKSSENSSTSYKTEQNKLSSSLQHTLASSGNSNTFSANSNFRLQDFSGKNKSLASVIKNREENLKTFTRSGGKVSALDSLKGAWKASLYGARLTSQDAARSWIAKVFENTGDEELALEYNENMKSKLDRLNPNAIPNFLKNQNVDLDSMRSLKDSEVPQFGKEKDEELVDEVLKEDKKYQEEKARWEMMQNMMNPLFQVFNFSASDKTDKDLQGPDAPADLNKTEIPSNSQTNSYWVDEDGNIYPNNNFGNNPPWGQCLHQCGFNLPSCPGAECCEMAATCFV